jgi:hypothetical protein
MARRKIRRAKIAISGRCSHIVRYKCYPLPGVRTERHGQCSRWTITSCGKCRKHCQIACVTHKIMWMVAGKTRRELRRMYAS